MAGSPEPPTLPMKENTMSKGQHGNKEAKKPKKEHPSTTPQDVAAAAVAAGAVAPNRQKKK
jgi:hypothetical protein